MYSRMGRDGGNLDKSIMQSNDRKNSHLNEEALKNVVLMNTDDCGLDNKSVMIHNQTIGKLHIDNSHDVHIGPEFKTDQLIIIQSPSNDIFKDKNALPDFLHTHSAPKLVSNTEDADEDKINKFTLLNVTAKTQFALCIGYGVAFILMICLILIWKFDLPDDVPANVTTITPSTPTTVVPPKDWFVSVNKWSLVNNTVCPRYMKIIKQHLAIDNTNNGICNTESSCKHFLVEMQKQKPEINNINYNYLIGGDGRVYEARGNDYPSDEIQDFSTSFLKVALIGKYTDDSTLSTLQKDALNTLINFLIHNEYLTDEYTIVPQCCRNIPRELGPQAVIIKNLYQTYSSHWTNALCSMCAIPNKVAKDSHDEKKQQTTSTVENNLRLCTKDI